MGRHKSITVLGFILSIVLLYFSLRDIEFHKIWETLRRMNPFFALVPLAFIGSAVSLSSFKWSRIAGPTVRFEEAFVAFLIGLFINNVLPARIGEVARGYVLAKKKGVMSAFAEGSESPIVSGRGFSFKAIRRVLEHELSKSELNTQVAA